jgi:hypothetical protein
MALLFCDGIDVAAIGDFVKKGWGNSATAWDSIVAGQTGNAFKWGTGYISYAFSEGGKDKIYVGFHSKYDSINYYLGGPIIAFCDSSLVMWGLCNKAAGLLELRRVTTNNMGVGSYLWTTDASYSTNIGFCSKRMRENTWEYIELYYYAHDSAGAIEIKLNGESVGSWTGIQTTNTTSSGSKLAHLFYMFGLYTDTFRQIDNVYVCDTTGTTNNSFLGPVQVRTILPSTGNGSNTDFTCSTGTDHGEMVNETTPNDDTDYVYSSTQNHIDTWNYPAMGVTGTIKAVASNLYARNFDAGSRAIAAVTRPASTNRVHATNHYLSSEYNYKQSIWETNPEDSLAWEVTDVDGAEFGVKVTV